MNIYIGADHNGVAMRDWLCSQLKNAGYEMHIVGDQDVKPEDDFPQFAEMTVRAMQADGHEDSKAILICGSGQGMCMAANRFKGIRASLVWDADEARASRNDDDSNVLCLPSRYMSNQDALNNAVIWLATQFAGASRFARRIKELDQLG